jgi:hypothetical protein
VLEKKSVCYISTRTSDINDSWIFSVRFYNTNLGFMPLGVSGPGFLKLCHWRNSYTVPPKKRQLLTPLLKAPVRDPVLRISFFCSPPKPGMLESASSQG